jgi:hypothetical protein
LIDWERPKFQEHILSDDKDSDNAKAKSRSRLDVNAWRSLFLLNKFNELQTTKIIRTDFTLILYALVMEGFGLKYWTSYSPNLVTFDNGSPLNYILFFFVTTLLIYVIGLG